MKREFLQNFKVGEEPLPKEIIDAIMEENGRDIEAAKTAAAKPFADYESIKEQLQTAKDSLKAFEGVDVAQLQSKISELNGQLADKDKEWQGKLDEMAFDGVLKDVIAKAKGRSEKAIRALLDLDTLKASKNREADAEAAVEALKKDAGYLFGDDNTPPKYRGKTGGDPVLGDDTSKMTYSELCAYMEANPGVEI